MPEQGLPGGRPAAAGAWPAMSIRIEVANDQTLGRAGFRLLVTPPRPRLGLVVNHRSNEWWASEETAYICGGREGSPLGV
jgi:hypothetical protein